MEYTIYCSPNYCIYTEMVKTLLSKRGKNYKVNIISSVEQANNLKCNLLNLSENDTISLPQIFKGNTHIGGYEKLKRKFDEYDQCECGCGCGGRCKSYTPFG